MKKMWKKIITLLIVLALIITSIHPFSIKQVFAINKEVLYNESGCKITFVTNNEWEDGFEGQFLIENTGNIPIENWRFQIEWKHKISSIWDGEIESHKGDIYVLKYPSWNTKTPVGGKAVIGFNGIKTEKISIPSKCKLLIDRNDVSEEKYLITYKTTSDWQDGFNGQISITNSTEDTIEGWELEFDFSEDIINFWTAKLISHEGNHYVIKNDEWNSIIKPGATINLGFEGKTGNVTAEPENYKLTEIKTEEIGEIPEEPPTNSGRRKENRRNKGGN